jgi:hypothetical protein
MLRQVTGDAVEITADQLTSRCRLTTISNLALWRPDPLVLSDEELEAKSSEQRRCDEAVPGDPPDHPDVRRYERLTEAATVDSG